MKIDSCLTRIPFREIRVPKRIACVVTTLMLLLTTHARAETPEWARAGNWLGTYSARDGRLVPCAISFANGKGSFRTQFFSGSLLNIEYVDRLEHRQGEPTPSIRGSWSAQNQNGFFVFRRPVQGLLDGYWGDEWPTVVGTWDAVDQRQLLVQQAPPPAQQRPAPPNDPLIRSIHQASLMHLLNTQHNLTVESVTIKDDGKLVEVDGPKLLAPKLAAVIATIRRQEPDAKVKWNPTALGTGVDDMATVLGPDAGNGKFATLNRAFWKNNEVNYRLVWSAAKGRFERGALVNVRLRSDHEKIHRIDQGYAEIVANVLVKKQADFFERSYFSIRMTPGAPGSKDSVQFITEFKYEHRASGNWVSVPFGTTAATRDGISSRFTTIINDEIVSSLK